MEKKLVEIADMLAARDARRERQAALLSEYASPLICFTMNIAGPEKRDALIDRAFEYGVNRITEQLSLRGIPVLDMHKKIAFTGDECVWAVRGDARALKRCMCRIEDDGEIGRLFDIDVIGADGRKLSRSDAQPDSAFNAPRRCLLCGQDAFLCARSRAHGWRELADRAHEIIASHFDRAHAARVGRLAQRAILFEASVTPKPGLVDNENNGAHRDMNRFTLIDSACVLRPYFDACALAGIEHRGDPAAAFDRISDLGVRAEAEMMEECHTNTHKGELFTLGILSCAAAMAGEGADADAVLNMAGRIAAPCMDRFAHLSAETASTGGERQYVELGYTGVRGEAAASFPTVRDVALPALRNALARGMDENAAAVDALLCLIACVRDSNILRRGGIGALNAVMRDAERLVESGYTMDDVRRMNDRFVRMNVSPGGSADLLAAAVFLNDLCGQAGSAFLV